MSRFPRPTRPTPRHHDGASLIEPAVGEIADFIRNKGEKCPVCGAEIDRGEMEVLPDVVTIDCTCVECSWTVKGVFRLIDALQ